MQDYKEDIDQYIKENNVVQGVGSGNFSCPFCKDTQHHGEGRELKYTGPQIDRYDDAGFDFKQVLICPRTKQEYWYLNGV